MNPLLGRLLAFGLGCATASALWSPSQRNAPPPGAPANLTPPGSDAHRNNPFDLEAALAAALDAKSPAEQAAAALELARIPPGQIPDALERVTLVENHQLTLTAKALLVRWGETDGEAAMQWAWDHLRKQGQWDQAFRQVGSAWAWTNPQSFGAWILGSLGSDRPVFYDPSTDQDATTPKISFESINRACRWLAPEDPRLATRLYKQRGGFSSDDHKFTLSFKTVDQVREALTAFDNLDELTPFRIEGNQFIPHQLLHRWRELDPRGFESSPYASILSGSASDEIDEQTRSWADLPTADRGPAADRLLADTDSGYRDVQLVRLASEWTRQSPEEASAWIDSLPTADRNRALRAHTRVRATADLHDTIAWIGGRPAGDQGLCLAIAFDSWRSMPAAEQPDQSTWPEFLRHAWSDLEALESPAPD